MDRQYTSPPNRSKTATKIEEKVFVFISKHQRGGNHSAFARYSLHMLAQATRPSVVAFSSKKLSLGAS
jgi:hypothetical protein